MAPASQVMVGGGRPTPAWRGQTRHDAEGAVRNTKRFAYSCPSPSSLRGGESRPNPRTSCLSRPSRWIGRTEPQIRDFSSRRHADHEEKKGETVPPMGLISSLRDSPLPREINESLGMARLAGPRTGMPNGGKIDSPTGASPSCQCRPASTTSRPP